MRKSCTHEKPKHPLKSPSDVIDTDDINMTAVTHLLLCQFTIPFLPYFNNTYPYEHYGSYDIGGKLGIHFEGRLISPVI